ncbi:TPA: hypothetical protein HIQ39_003656, partial [Escherichia coli]|nr:hypothetical protein [Escherichia coli]
MTPVKVWQERVEIPTYETGPQDIHPMFLENRVYQGSSGAVYPYGVTDTLSEQKTLKSWQAAWPKAALFTTVMPFIFNY